MSFSKITYVGLTVDAPIASLSNLKLILIGLGICNIPRVQNTSPDAGRFIATNDDGSIHQSMDSMIWTSRTAWTPGSEGNYSKEVEGTDAVQGQHDPQDRCSERKLPHMLLRDYISS